MKFHKDKNGHWLPILPPGDPNMPRAKPNVSVMDLAENKRVKKHALVGAGLSIVDKAGKPLDFDSKSASPSPKVMNLSTSKKPVGSSSEGSEVKAQQVGVVPPPKIVVNEAGVMPLPNLGKPADESKAGSENLDNAEDDSHIAAIENGPEGNKEIQDDDQNPDGQVHLFCLFYRKISSVMVLFTIACLLFYLIRLMKPSTLTNNITSLTRLWKSLLQRMTALVQKKPKMKWRIV